MSLPLLAICVWSRSVAGRLWMLDYTYHRVWSVPLADGR
jgi:hypothetical protein